MTRMILLIPLAAVLLACGWVSGADSGADEPAYGAALTPAVPTEEPGAQLPDQPLPPTT